MIRGTTPTHTFALPFEPQEGTEYRIVYAQGEDYQETNLFEITTERCQVSGKTLSVRLTREETLKFNCHPTYVNGRYTTLPVKIQLGIQTPFEDILWSEIVTTTVDRCLRKDGLVCDG